MSASFVVALNRPAGSDRRRLLERSLAQGTDGRQAEHAESLGTVQICQLGERVEGASRDVADGVVASAARGAIRVERATGEGDGRRIKAKASQASDAWCLLQVEPCCRGGRVCVVGNVVEHDAERCR